MVSTLPFASLLWGCDIQGQALDNQLVFLAFGKRPASLSYYLLALVAISLASASTHSISVTMISSRSMGDAPVKGL
jgi:hypothetical protein